MFGFQRLFISETLNLNYEENASAFLFVTQATEPEPEPGSIYTFVL